MNGTSIILDVRYRDLRVTTKHLSKIADLNRKIEAARSAGDTFRLQRLIAQRQRLLESDDRQPGK
jgi:hypothetical protein